METCDHYTRGCKFISPCCNKIVNCRICHNNENDHEIDRFKIVKIKCNFCDTEQDVSNECVHCEKKFGDYFCSICRLYDVNPEKQYFHCEKCGICRVGNKDEIFHCDECNICYSIKLKDNHNCKKQLFMTDCCICLNDLFSSRESSIVLQCNHVIHVSCANEWMKKNITCPICRKTMLDNDIKKKYIEHIDKLIQDNPIENELKINIHCNDCSKENEINFHPYGQKCSDCGSYNTTY